MYKRILVPVDGSDASNQGLSEAIRLAKEEGAALRLVHVVDELIMTGGLGGAMVYPGDVVDQLRASGTHVLERADAMAQAQHLAAESVLLEHFGGPAAPLIVEEAKNWSADLIVIGTHGRRGLRRIVMGSDAEAIVRTTPVPVLLIRSATSTAA
jgi:nucleotide-binding universal stress UspA family protein